MGHTLQASQLLHMHYRDIFFTLRYFFTITRRAIHGFTTSIHGSTKSIGLQHFQEICRVSMLPIEVPQPLQQPMLLYKPLASFVALYTQPNSNRCCDLYTKFFRGSTISHWKYLFNISNGYFTKSHLASWFERYHRLNLNM
jgi:hypothetical protein